MPITSEALKQDLDQLTDEQLAEVADFIAFLKFRDKRRRVAFDPASLAALETEFAEDDRALAEAGISNYATMLDQEDQLCMTPQRPWWEQIAGSFENDPNFNEAVRLGKEWRGSAE